MLVGAHVTNRMMAFFLSLRTVLLFAGIFSLLSPAVLLGQKQAAPSAQEVVTQMVKTETAAYKTREKFLYLRKVRSAKTKGHLWEEVVAETPEGRMRRLLSVDGKPLSAEEKKVEDDRITYLVNHPDQFRREEQGRKDDETRLGTLLAELPRLYVFKQEGASEDGCLRIAFHPNPAFQEETYQDRVLHATSGYLFVRTPEMRLCAMNAHLDHRVEFGYGLLGKVSENSKFSMTRSEVAPGEWKTTKTDIHVDGSLLLLKSYSRDEQSDHFGFKTVAPDLSLAQAASLVRSHGN
jgi:hypothetical protein